MAITASISGTLSITDNLVGSVAQNILLNLAYTGTVQTYAETVQTSTSPLSIALPVSPTEFVAIFNLDTVDSVIVTWTPTGGSSNVVQTVDPGGFLAFCQTTTSNGISALSVQATANNPAIKYVLCG